MPETKIADELMTVRDYWRYAISRFTAAKLSFGHGTTTATDASPAESARLTELRRVLHGQRHPHERLVRRRRQEWRRP